jgi:hypothetical protein
MYKLFKIYVEMWWPRRDAVSPLRLESALQRGAGRKPLRFRNINIAHSINWYFMRINILLCSLRLRKKSAESEFFYCYELSE